MSLIDGHPVIDIYDNEMNSADAKSWKCIIISCANEALKDEWRCIHLYRNKYMWDVLFVLKRAGVLMLAFCACECSRNQIKLVVLEKEPRDLLANYITLPIDLYIGNKLRRWLFERKEKFWESLKLDGNRIQG